MSEVNLINIYTNIFSNRKIRQIENLPNGDSLIVIWFKLLCLAGNINKNGVVYITKDIPYNNETLATAFNRPLSTIKLAITTFEKFGMIEIIDEVIYILNWNKYQNIESVDESVDIVKEKTRQRVQKYRDKQKELCNVTCNANVTLQSVTKNEKKQEKERSKEKELKKEKNICFIVTSDSNIVNDYEKVFKLWNESEITTHRYLTEEMINAINKALSIYGFDKVEEGIKHYSKIFKDEKYFFNYKWKLVDFLKQSNALPTFLEEGDKWQNYINSSSNKKEVKKSTTEEAPDWLNEFKSEIHNKEKKYE